MNVAIQTSKLKKIFGDTVAVDDLDLCVYQGELLALLGECIKVTVDPLQNNILRIRIVPS